MIKTDQTNENKILYREESYLIQGAIFEVYKELGCGFLEAVYQECLCSEFMIRKIPFRSQVDLTIMYKANPISQTYRADFVCYEKILIELKAVKELGVEHRAQVMNYLKATKLRLGLLVNFGHYPLVAIERIIL